MEDQPEGASPKAKGSARRSLTFNNLIDDDNLDLSFKRREHPDDRRARLEKEREDARHARVKEYLTIAVFSLLIGSVSAACLWVIVSPVPMYQSDLQKQAFTLLAAIVSGAANFFAGKAAGEAKAARQNRLTVCLTVWP